MMSSVTSLLLILAFYPIIPTQTSTPLAFRHDETITVKYDKFKDLTAVFLWKMKMGVGALDEPPPPMARRSTTLSLIAHYSGKDRPPVFSDAVLLVVGYDNLGVIFPRTPDLIFLIDGRRETVSMKGREISFLEGDRSEASASVPHQLIQQIVSSKHVEGQFGPIEFHFDKENSEAIKDFDSRLHL